MEKDGKTDSGGFYTIKFHYDLMEPGSIVAAETEPMPMDAKLTYEELIELGKSLNGGEEPERWEYFPCGSTDGAKPAKTKAVNAEMVRYEKAGDKLMARSEEPGEDDLMCAERAYDHAVGAAARTLGTLTTLEDYKRLSGKGYNVSCALLLKELREKSELKRDAFCRRIGVTVDQLKNYESGRTCIPRKVMEKAEKEVCEK